ncbi:MAG: class I SAM-dependent methyltransferase [Alphaproteobacteria bacterium]
MTARDPALDFYDDLAGEYHLIHADWDDSLARQAAALDAIIRARLGPGTLRLLDCSCGIGTQALGLAALDYRVHATDISPEAVARAGREAGDRGLVLSFGVADLRELETQVAGEFDVVLSCDNALAHMRSGAEVEQAIANMAAKVAPGGLLLASIRDYDALVRDRPVFAPPSIFDAPTGRRVVVQLWDWEPDGRGYRMTLFILRPDHGGWTMKHYETTMRAVLRDEVSAAIARAGLGDVAWRMPGADGYYQPVVTARKPD